MKQIAALLLCSISIPGSAQPCTWTTYPTDTTATLMYADADLRSDGGGVQVLNEAYTGDIVVMRTDPAGVLLWRRHFSALDPQIYLSAGLVFATADGGLTVVGWRGVGDSYSNSFGFHLDSSGNEVWARIFMVPGYNWSTAVCATQDDGFLLVVHQGQALGNVVARFDQNGQPLWSRNLGVSMVPAAYDPIYSVLEEPNGDLFFSGNLYHHPFVIHTNAQAIPDWAYVFGSDSLSGTQAFRASNGDYLVSGGTYSTYPYYLAGLMRLDANGGVLWRRTYTSSMGITGIAERANGEIILGCWQAGNDSVSVVRTNASGIPIAAHRWGSNAKLTDVIGLRNDSLWLGTSVPYSSPSDFGMAGILLTQDPADLACAMDPIVVGSSADPLPGGITDTIYSDTSSVKSWLMALNDPLGVDDLDLEAYLSGNAARPGFNTWYWGNVTNFGGATSGPVSTTITIDPQLNYVNAWPTPTAVVGNQISWSGQSPLGEFGSQGFQVQVYVPVALGIGTPIASILSAAQDSVEISLVNNTWTENQVTKGSWDPNDKLVWPEDEFVLNTDSILNYTIRFQNTGTDTAFTVVVVDTLPNELNISSLRLGASSHAYTYALTASGLLTFTFNNILLPDSNVNESMSHGLVSFRIRPDEGLLPGTVISNAADIYFDFNPPVRTPDALVVVSTATGIPGPRPEESPFFYPVPVSDVLTVLLPDGFSATMITITALDGRPVSERLERVTGLFTLPVHGMSAGAYIVTFHAENGRIMTHRFVKE